MAANGKKEGVKTLPSGLQYKILRQGFGRRPASNDVVVCAFQGAFVDGRVFDSSERQGKPTVLPLNKTLRGWREALELMPAGSKWQIYVPSALAFGEKGAGRDIGPNATIIYEIELLAVNPQIDDPNKIQRGELIYIPNGRGENVPRFYATPRLVGK